MTDYAIFFCLLLPGVILLGIGIYNNIKLYNLKDIVHFPLVQEVKTALFTKAGSYCIMVVGGSSVKQFPFKIVSLTANTPIDAYRVVPAARSIKNGRLAVLYCRFFIPEAGEYALIINDYSKIEVREFAALPDSIIQPPRLSLVIKEYTPPVTFLIAVTATLCGMLLVLFSIGWMLRNHGVIVPSHTGTKRVTTYTF